MSKDNIIIIDGLRSRMNSRSAMVWIMALERLCSVSFADGLSGAWLS